MTKEEAIEILNRDDDEMRRGYFCANDFLAIETLKQEPKTEWIPVAYHYMSDEEAAEKDLPSGSYWFDSEMPYDGQEILVTVRFKCMSTGKTMYYTDKDVCVVEDCGFGLESGQMWRDDVIAWQPLPEPYESEVQNDIR